MHLYIVSLVSFFVFVGASMSCDVTLNSTDVIVKCDSSGVSNVPENVTILICINNNEICNSDLFCNPKYGKLRVLDIENNGLKVKRMLFFLCLFGEAYII